MKRKRNHVLFGALSCIIAVSIYGYLNMADEFPAGWTDPINLNIRGGSPALMIDDDTFFLAFKESGDEESIITIYSSKDGREWVTTDHVERHSGDIYTPSSPQWLQRPHDEIWFVWNSGRKSNDGFTEIKYYAILDGEGKLSEHSILHSIDDNRWSLCEITSTASGGFAMLNMYYPPCYIKLQGRVIEGSGDSDTLVQIADENLQWDDPIAFSDTTFSYSQDIVLDDEGTLWALYTESQPKEGTYVRTSEDGKTWSEPMFITKELTVNLFQRKTGQYLLFILTDDNSLYVKYSEDGIEWSSPHFISNFIRATSVTVAESDDGTVWIIVDGSFIYLLTFTDEKYKRDMELLQEIHQRNGILALGTALLFFSFCYLFQRKKEEKYII